MAKTKTTPAASATDTIVAPAAPSAVNVGQSEILEIPLDKIDLAEEKFQARGFDPTSEDYQQKLDFAKVNQHWLGLIVVSRGTGGRFILHDGRHRFEASRAAGWKTIDARVFKSFDQSQGLLLGLMGNTSKPMSKLEIASAVAVYLGTDKKATIQDAAAKCCVTPNTIRNYLSLNNVCAEGQKLIDSGKIKAASAYALAALPQDIQAKWLDQAQEAKTGKFIKACQEYARDLKADPTPRTRASAGERASKVNQASKVLGQNELEAMLEEALAADPKILGKINAPHRDGLVDGLLIALGRKPEAPATRELGADTSVAASARKLLK